MGSGDDGAHSQNEKIEVRNYIEGVRLFFTSLAVLYKFVLFLFNNSSNDK